MRIDDDRLSDLEYIIIPGRLHKQPELESVHDLAFTYWKSFWESVFIENGCPGDLNEDCFLRQNMICLLKSKNEIAGMHLYSFYNLKSPACQNHSYIKGSFNDYYLQTLNANGVKYAMSIEYLTVNPKWRKKDLGLSLANILLGLSGYVLKSIDYDACIAPSRADVGVTRMVCEMGGQVIVPEIEMHKTVCDLVAIYNSDVRPHPDEPVNEWIKTFWRNRLDYTRYTEMRSNYFKNQQNQNQKTA